MDPKDIRRKIRDLLATRGPLTRKEVVAEFSPEEADADAVEATINKLVSLQVLFPSPRNRVADFDVEKTLREKARTLVQEAPRSRKGLASELEQLGTGVSKHFLEKTLFQELQDQPDIFLHFGPNNQLLLSTEVPDPEQTLKPLHDRIAALEKAGIDRTQILTILFGEAPVATTSDDGKPAVLLPAKDDDDLDFQRDACELLVYAWQDAESEEMRKSLEPIMRNLGLISVGEAGSEAEFNGLHHTSEDSLSKGDSVNIVLPGWQLKNRRGEYLIARARVTSTNQPQEPHTNGL
ncbi:MAG: hypothetical protein AAF191_06730 [Verrucomicrobiota bacterium]